MLIRAAALSTVALLLAAPLAAADLSGIVFEDLDQDGIYDPGEQVVERAAVRVVGTADAGGPVDMRDETGKSGTYHFSLPDGCYVVEVEPPADYRLGPVRTDCPGGAPEPYPIGQRRTSSGAGVVDRMAAGSFRHFALGDSIAAGVSFCFLDDTNYHNHVHDERVRCVLPAAQLNNSAVAGHTTPHLLRDFSQATDTNTVLDAIDSGADLVTISIGGNDFLDVDPGGQDPGGGQNAVVLEACAARALNAMRANIQEALSGLVAGLPRADVEINSIYDNTGSSCSGTDFHNRWAPLGNELLRNVAWGQARRVTVAEVWPDYAHMNVQGTDCCGFQDLICNLDGIHPDAEGRRVHENRLWESFGGVLLGPRDDAGSTVQTADFPILRRVDSRRPTLTRDLTTDGVADPDLVLAAGDDAGALVPVSGGAFHVEGFEAEPGGVSLERAVAVLRYRGVGNHVDDRYWFEASFDPAFPPPGETLTTWSTIIPIVGGSPVGWSLDTGARPWSCDLSDPTSSGYQILVDPSPADWRTVSAMLTRNIEEPDPPSGAYTFPKVTFIDLESLSVRIRTEPVGPADDFQIEWDAVWVDLYGASAGSPDLGGATKQALDAGTLDPVTEAQVDQLLTYVITFANQGEAPATGVEFQDTLPGCLAFESGPLLDGVPAGSFAGGVVTVPVGDLPADAAPHEVRFEVRVTAACAGGSVENQGLLTSAEDPAGVSTDDPATPAPGDPTVFSVPGSPLSAVFTPGLLADPTPADPYDCGEARLDPVLHDCTGCLRETQDLWRVAGGAAGSGLVLYEVPGRGCSTAGDSEVLCLHADGARDLFLELAPAAGGC